MRRFLTALVAILAIASFAPVAAGQCTISSIAVSGGYQLCAQSGSAWQWTGPAGFSDVTMCVDVGVPGTYTLRVWDGVNGLWSAPCTFTFADVPGAPPCSISGADSVCVGSSTSWCAPTGNLLYAWTGPDGFSASTACIDVSVAGEYWLFLADMTTGISGGPCSRTLRVSDCAPPPIDPPPSDPPPSSPMCPATARWWTQSCNGRDAHVPAAVFAQIAARVDQRSAVWDFSETAAGLCGLLQPGHDHSVNDAATARRQYAAVLANLSAGELNVIAPDGHRVGLAASASLEGLRSMPAGHNVGEWVAATEAKLVSLATVSSRARSARDEFRRIAIEARAINRRLGGCRAGLDSMIEDDDQDFSFGASTDVSFGTMSTGQRQDPLAGAARLRWTLLRSEPVELRVMDITGRSVRHLASGVFSAGTHDFAWDGRDDDGRAVHSGAYFVAGRVGDQRLSQRLFILR